MLPGQAISYIVDFGNKGTVPGCNNHIEVTLPAAVEPMDEFSDFKNLLLKDAA
jgi:hypothetical protein